MCPPHTVLTTPGPPPWDPGPRPREQALSRRLGRLLSRTHAALHDFVWTGSWGGGAHGREVQEPRVPVLL